MSKLLAREPYGPRDDDVLLAELTHLTEHHDGGCAEYRAIAADAGPIRSVEDVPFLHVEVFKELRLETSFEGQESGRFLLSSATSGRHSQIRLDDKSSQLQSESTKKIFSSLLGEKQRPLIVLDSVTSLRQRGKISARIAAALSLRPLASDLLFALDDPEDPSSMRWEAIEAVLEQNDEVLVYGFSWILWTSWGKAELPNRVADAIAQTRVSFVHSGGWKKLEAEAVDRDRFDEALLSPAAPLSTVLDYYGLVEQVGVIYPLCESGYRHVPVWADVVVRDSLTHQALVGSPGQIQLLNSLAWGAPYHSVLTEDQGVIEPGPCPCGRSGRRFQLLGRLPRAEVRGCANV